MRHHTALIAVGAPPLQLHAMHTQGYGMAVNGSSGDKMRTTNMQSPGAFGDLCNEQLPGGTFDRA